MRNAFFLCGLKKGVPEASSTPPEIMDVTKDSASLAWTKPKDDGGSKITGYFLEYKEVSSDKWVRHETLVTSIMYTITGLITDAEYQFRVIAVNDIGESQPGTASDPVVCKDPFGKNHFLITVIDTECQCQVCNWKVFWFFLCDRQTKPTR